MNPFSSPRSRRITRFLAIADSELAKETAAPRCRERPGQVNLDPPCASLHVSPAPSAVEKVEVKKWLPAKVEDGGLFLHDACPRAHLGDHLGNVIE
jgi:hypothetical protein